MILEKSVSWKIPKISNQSCLIKLNCHVPVMAHVLVCARLQMMSNSDSRPPWIWSQLQQSYLGWAKRGPFVVGVVASPFKVSKRKCSFMHWPVPLIPFPSCNWRTRLDDWMTVKPDVPGQKEAPPALDALCPCLWVSFGWDSFAREQAEEDGRFWFLWIQG